jgi:hypothetical protein
MDSECVDIISEIDYVGLLFSSRRKKILQIYLDLKYSMELGDKSGKDIYGVICSASKTSEEKLKLITQFLKNGSNPNYINEEGYTNLDFAITNTKYGTAEDRPFSKQIVILLIDNGGITNKMSILFESIRENSINIVKKLIEKKYILKKSDNDKPIDEITEIHRLLDQPGQISKEIREIVNKYIVSLQLKNIRVSKRLDPARLTGKNAPSTAFVVMGHGSETASERIVPPGSILVTQVHSGELNYLNGEYFTDIFNHVGITKETILDPITNYKRVVDLINLHRGYNTSLAIYREGDRYPDFFYSLLSSWDSKTYIDFVGQPNSYKCRDSGIAKYPFDKGTSIISGTTQHVATEVVNKYNDPGKDNFLRLYDKSEYPTRAELQPIIEKGGLNTMQKIIDSPEIGKKINLFQSDLFKKLGAGVYYNLVCRATNAAIRVVDSSTQRSILNNSQIALVNSSGHIHQEKREVLQRIEEAELHRKNLIARLNKNNLKRNPIPAIPLKQHKILLTPKQGASKGKMTNKWYSELMNFYNREIKEISKNGISSDNGKKLFKEYTDKKNNLLRIIHRSTQDTNTEVLLQEPLPVGQRNDYVTVAEQNLGFNERRRAAEMSAAAKVSEWKKRKNTKKTRGGSSGRTHTYKKRQNKERNSIKSKGNTYN